MNTDFWGPHSWVMLHTITFNAPLIITDKQKYIELFSNLQDVLPCKYCRQSYKFFYNNLSIHEYLDDRMGIVYWLYAIHTLVNFKLKKKNMATFREVVMFYESNRAEKLTEDEINLFIINTERKYLLKTYNYLKNIITKLDAVNWNFEVLT